MSERTLSVRVPAEEADRFKEECRKLDVTPSQVLRAAIREFLAAAPKSTRKK